MIKDLKIGDYVSFEHTGDKVLYKVLDIDKKKVYFLYRDVETYNDEGWERIDYIHNVYRIVEKGE